MSVNPSHRIGPARRFAVATSVVGIALAGASGLAFADAGKKAESPKRTASEKHSESAKPEPTKTESPKPDPTSTTGYPPVPASCTTNTGTVGFRGQVRFSCSGFGSNELVTITITVNGVTRTYTVVTADASGSFTVFVRVGEAGLATITATGNTTHKSGSATVLVVGGHHKKGGTATEAAVVSANTVAVERPSVAGAPGTRLVSASDQSANYNAATATWGAVGVMGLGAGLLMLAAAKRRKEDISV